jgi:DNA-binding MarR family transcriptional regulator
MSRLQFGEGWGGSEGESSAHGSDPGTALSADSPVDVSSARDVLRSCLCSRTRMLERVLTRLYDDALDPVGIRVNQLTMLSIIASMASLRAVDIGRFLEIDKSTVSRGLASLKAKGWVMDTRPANGAPKRLALTAEGASILARAIPLWTAAGEAAEELLGKTSAEALRCAADAYLTRRAQS